MQNIRIGKDQARNEIGSLGECRLTAVKTGERAAALACVAPPASSWRSPAWRWRGWYLPGLAIALVVTLSPATITPALAQPAARTRAPGGGAAAAQATTQAGAPAGRSVNGTNTAPAVGAPAEELAVPVRGQYALPLGASPARIAVGDPDVADVKVLPPGPNRAGQVLVLGKKAGTTQLQVWTGNNRTPQVWNVRVLGDVQATLAARGAASTAQVDVAGEAAVVSGQASSVLDHRAGVEAARTAGAKDKVVDVSTINVGSVVQVEVKMVEVQRSTIKDVGITSSFGKGPWSIASGLIPGDLLSSTNGFAFGYASNHFSAQLALLEQNGLARVLAEPTLLAQSGQSASFLAGGEIPIPVAGGLGTQNVEFKPFGIGLSVTPTVISPSRIALKVAPEASELDPTNGITISTGSTGSATSTTTIPALSTRKADTTVELGDGETFIISGLVSRQTKAAVNKVPFLGDLPIIGAFFRGVSYSQNDRELVIVVTPHLVRPIARGVSLPMPGAREEVGNTPTTAWGYYLMGPAGGQQMPGFSR
ncbi:MULTISPECIES: type II and III secretion system protein family protein [unclassified Achromobacter]|uniref:type II and III secretion system protein family protein n=1 Tax=unclassified Achromobacter TaxID=2626865 RepID=UPI000B51639A|nr:MULTISPECIES: type II and III secretion system protein family protein [unclassified Achromobacter]OWT77547.1 type II secretion system protein [Achromobacter sp. HZ28]OWT78427.1 type II secretion system protein [Achromobacter sp. HZ34]